METAPTSGDPVRVVKKYRIKKRRQVPTFRHKMYKKYGFKLVGRNLSLIFAVGIILCCVIMGIMQLWIHGLGNSLQ